MNRILQVLTTLAATVSCAACSGSAVAHGVAAPAGTPPKIQARLGAETQQFQVTPELRALPIKLGVDSLPANCTVFVVRSAVKRWTKVVAASGAVID